MIRLMRRLILALLCVTLLALPAQAQSPQGEPNVLQNIGEAVRGFINRIFGAGASKPDEPARAQPAKPQPDAKSAAQPETQQPPSAPPPTPAVSPAVRPVDRGLHDAIASGNYESALKMIEQGADIEAKDPEAGGSVLHFAVMKGKLALVDLLVTRGADIGSRTRNGTTPLHTAVLYAQLPVVEFLIDRGADINAQSASGTTPLALALAAKHDRIAARLKELGAR